MEQLQGLRPGGIPPHVRNVYDSSHHYTSSSLSESEGRIQELKIAKIESTSSEIEKKKLITPRMMGNTDLLHASPSSKKEEDTPGRCGYDDFN